MSLFTVKMLKNDLPKRAADLRPKASRVVRATVFKIEGDAKGRARVDTGEMRDSTQGEMLDDLTGQVVCGAEHGIYNEWGTYKMPAAPFMTPAAEAARGSFESAMREIVE